ncbi:protein of unknown function [Pararobbsia alpina]
MRRIRDPDMGMGMGAGAYGGADGEHRDSGKTANKATNSAAGQSRQASDQHRLKKVTSKETPGRTLATAMALGRNRRAARFGTPCSTSLDSLRCEQAAHCRIRASGPRCP